MKKIILASQSPRRKELLEQIRVDFEVQSSQYEENNSLNLAPDELVKKFSKEKALDVVSRNKNAIVIGVDEVVVFNRKTIGKPRDKEDAFNTLKMMNGHYHEVMTAYTIIDTDTMKTLTNLSITKVKMKKLTDEQIERYIEEEKPLDKAGSYGMQDGKGALLVERIEGDYYTVPGLPLAMLADDLRRFGIDVL